MADVNKLGQAGLQGWRAKVGDGVATPVASRTPLEADQIRAVLGAVFFALSVAYVVKTVLAAQRELRG